ncbi:ankyrin repeat-containing protein [Carex littledalei]|uniref:Ankyrin repeat-containing protein n=1 Tax=Carex littledalei TaxID=544730 RepID=A0A833VEW7_9POAL|nr:ankyrin repeat-containing protein [Carex littledalei]
MAGIELTSDPSCSAATEAVNDESLRATGMHPRLLEACRSGNCGLFDYLYDQLIGPDILKDKTPYSNTALHLAVMLGHDTFARKVLFREPSLLTSLNNDRKTPLIAALMTGNSSMARALIAAAVSSREPPDHDLERALPRNHLCEMLEMADLCGQNALHHALRSMPDRDVALHILNKVRDHQETAVRLSCQVSKNG